MGLLFVGKQSFGYILNYKFGFLEKTKLTPKNPAFKMHWNIQAQYIMIVGAINVSQNVFVLCLRVNVRSLK